MNKLVIKNYISAALHLCYFVVLVHLVLNVVVPFACIVSISLAVHLAAMLPSVKNVASFFLFIAVTVSSVTAIVWLGLRVIKQTYTLTYKITRQRRGICFLLVVLWLMGSMWLVPAYQALIFRKYNSISDNVQKFSVASYKFKKIKFVQTEDYFFSMLQKNEQWDMDAVNKLLSENALPMRRVTEFINERRHESSKGVLSQEVLPVVSLLFPCLLQKRILENDRDALINDLNLYIDFSNCLQNPSLGFIGTLAGIRSKHEISTCLSYCLATEFLSPEVVAEKSNRLSHNLSALTLYKGGLETEGLFRAKSIFKLKSGEKYKLFSLVFPGISSVVFSPELTARAYIAYFSDSDILNYPFFTDEQNKNGSHDLIKIIKKTSFGGNALGLYILYREGLQPTVLGEGYNLAIKADAWMLCHETLGALKKYFNVHGGYPKILEDLVPQYLSRVPDNVYLKGSICYQAEDSIIFMPKIEFASSEHTLSFIKENSIWLDCVTGEGSLDYLKRNGPPIRGSGQIQNTPPEKGSPIRGSGQIQKSSPFR